jgi:hypothetical protein
MLNHSDEMEGINICKAVRIKSFICAVSSCFVFLPAFASNSSGELEGSLIRLRAETNVATAEANGAKLLEEYTNSPEATGRIFLTMALKREYRAPHQTNGIAKIIDASEKALQFPLDVIDKSSAYECLGGAIQMRITAGLSLREETVARKQELVAFLNGLKLIVSKARTLQKQPVPVVSGIGGVVYMSSDGTDGREDPYYKAIVKEHEAEMKSREGAIAANDLVDRYQWFKSDIVNLYRGVPYVEEITEEGEKIMPGAPVLKELVEEVRKANAAPHSTPETKPAP